jgi:hypothetical protein
MHQIGITGMCLVQLAIISTKIVGIAVNNGQEEP